MITYVDRDGVHYEGPWLLFEAWIEENKLEEEYDRAPLAVVARYGREFGVVAADVSQDVTA